MSDSELQRMQHARKYVRTKITKAFNNRINYCNLSDSERKEELIRVKTIKDRIVNEDQNIQIALWNTDPDAEDHETKQDAEVSACEQYLQKIDDCIAILTPLIGAVSSSSTVDNRAPINSRSIDSARSLLKSPIAPLPKYSGAEDEDLTRFLFQFDETTNKHNYPQYDKFLLLKQQCSGRALTLIDSLAVTSQTYADAVELLKTALDSPILKKFNIIKQFTELELTYETEPFSFISKYRKLAESVNLLKIDAESFMQYFFWTGLNETFKTQYVQLTNETRPSLEALNSRFFDACERYTHVKKNPQSRRPAGSSKLSSPAQASDGSTALAVKVEPSVSKAKKTATCSLCSRDSGTEVGHQLSKCSVYKDADAKLKRIKELKGCERCGGVSHNSSSCKFKFKYKCHCNEWHVSFLCRKPKPVREPALVTPNSTEPTNMVTHAKTMSLALENDSVLPTFTCLLKGEHKLRCLKDSGSQSNFISLDLANKFNLKVLQDKIMLRLKGINTIKTHDTKLVEVPISIKEKTYTIPAICVPELDVVCKFNNLTNLAMAFVDKGYQLADDYLLAGGDVINNIKFMLGTKSAYCLKTTEVSFGPNEDSIYANTVQGVMLVGDVSRALENSRFLPENRDVFAGCSLAPPSSTESSSYLEAIATDPSNVTITDSSNNSNVSNAASVDWNISNLSISSSSHESNSEINSGKNDNELVSDVPMLVMETSALFVTDSRCNISPEDLNAATEEMLNRSCIEHTNYDNLSYDQETSDTNRKLINWALDSVERSPDGRIILPLLWNSNSKHLLGQNRNLAMAILKSNYKKLIKNTDHFKLMDDYFKQQEDDGIIEKIPDVDEHLQNNPHSSFLPHMGVFKLNRETTKCRVVFLSNLCQRDPTKPLTVSHNQAMHSGPCLNQKISSALTQLRFGKFLLCYDLKRAFNQIELTESDSNKLMFLWFKNIKDKDFSVVAYRNIRLSFGIRCAPTLLMLSLYKLLVLDKTSDVTLNKLKCLMYQLLYMDNGAISGDTKDDLIHDYDQLGKIYTPYQFSVQQIVSNVEEIQAQADSLDDSKQTDPEVTLLGMLWDRLDDTLYTKPISLDENATSKRLILKSVASQYDVHNFNAPLMNRSRLFLHNLQCDKKLGWDDHLSPELIREWVNIARQANGAPPIKIARFIGSRSDSFRLVACTDASRQMYGAIVYLHNLSSNKLSFVSAKNRIVNTKLVTKSIPSLEMQGILLGVQCLVDVYKELSGPKCVDPINITESICLTDSLVSLHWLDSFSNKLDKMSKISVYVMNRLSEIQTLCNSFKVSSSSSIKFSFLPGVQNPADCVTRCISHKVLMKTSYISGPVFPLDSMGVDVGDILTVTIPNPLAGSVTQTDHAYGATIGHHNHEQRCLEHVIPLSRYSSFTKLAGVYSKVLLFIQKCKLSLKHKNPAKYSHFNVETKGLRTTAKLNIILREQRMVFPEVFEYFHSHCKTLKSTPKIITKLNVFIDKSGVLRVKSKFDRVSANGRGCSFPILLPRKSLLTELIVQSLHIAFSHVGCYSLLAELRKMFWIQSYYSAVKQIIKKCATCKRFNERTIKLNQSPYRNARISPPQLPFGYIYLDYMGPFSVKNGTEKTKVYILCITCMWSRAVNLKLCIDLTVSEFLRAFQLHSFQFGIPQFCVSDLGSQITAASRVITEFLNDAESAAFFEENGVQTIKFENYFKGCSKLGGLVEVCVKMSKRLLHGSMGNNILLLREFEFFVEQTVHLINRRPVAFHEALRDSLEAPDPITPERLIHGYDLVSINMIPSFQSLPSDEDFSLNVNTNLSDSYAKFRKVKDKLFKIYHEEFLANLVKQAVDDSSRYKPVHHEAPKVGDVVLVRETFTKPQQFPMAMVTQIFTNDSGEVTHAILKKGKTNELIKRHVTSLIPLLSLSQDESGDGDMVVDTPEPTPPSRLQRAAAVRSREATRQMLIDE